MKNFFASRYGQVTTGLSVFGAAAATAAPSFALSIVDYTGLGTSITAELTPAISAAIPIMGTIMAVGVGVHMLKKMIGK